MIDTRNVKIRTITLRSVGDAKAEVERLLDADRQGRLTARGNWTPGQIFAHLAAWINYAYDGYPAELAAPPLPIRLVLRLTRSKFLRSPLPKGFRVPKAPEGTFGMDRVETQVGGEMLLRALTRLATTPPIHPSPAFGVMTHEEAIQLQMRHCELHLGFLEPG